jgi:hypothetical protein
VGAVGAVVGMVIAMENGARPGGDRPVSPGAAAGTSAGGRPPSGGYNVYRPSTTRTTSAPRGPAATPSPAPTPGPGQQLIDGRSALELLKQLLPSGLTTSGYLGQDSYRPEVFGIQCGAGMAVDAGHGRAGIYLNVQQNIPIDIGDTIKTLPDGSVISATTVAGQKPTTGRYPGLSYQVQRVMPDGTRVAIDVDNYDDDPSTSHEKGWSVPTVSQDPPLTIDQLAAILSDPRWGLTVAKDFAAKARHDLVGYRDMTQTQ